MLRRISKGTVEQCVNICRCYESRIMKMETDIEELTRRVNLLESSVIPDKTITEEVVEHFISPAGLKTLYKVVPSSSNTLKDFDTLMGEKAVQVSNDVQTSIKDRNLGSIQGISDQMTKIVQFRNDGKETDSSVSGIAKNLLWNNGFSKK